MPDILDPDYVLHRFIAGLHVNTANAYRAGEDIGRSEGRRLAGEYLRRTQPRTLMEAENGFRAEMQRIYGEPRESFFFMERRMLDRLPEGQFKTEARRILEQMTEGAVHGYNAGVADQMAAYGNYIRLFG